MYFHILFSISMLTFCMGDSPNQATSSISFHRDDVPLSYKYHYVHVYSTEKPNSQIKPEIYKHIQYAPLVSNHNDKDTYDRLYTKAVASKWGNTQNVTRNEYLQPRVQSSGNDNGKRQFVSGYNIYVPRQNNFRYNNINSEHKNIATDNEDIQTKKTLLFHKNTESIPHRNLESSHNQFNNLLALNARKHQEQPSKSMHILSVMENPEIHPVFNSYVKVPQLHLNLAHAYNFAPSLVKTPLSGYHKLQRKHEQSLIKNIDSPVLQKNILHPLNNNRIKKA